MGLMVLALPYLLNRIFTQQEYAVWVLGFQAAIYVPMFGLGIHQLMIRAIAHNLSHGSQEQARKSISAGLAVVILLFLISCAFVFLGGWFVADIAKASAENHLAIEEVWWKVGFASSMGLFSLFFFGCFGGIQRYEWENLYKAIYSLLFVGLITLTWVLGLKIDSGMLANFYGLAIMLGLSVLLLRFMKQKTISLPLLSLVAKPEMRTYFLGMYGISVWQIGILMVSGFDILIVSRVGFSAVPGYSIALSFLVFMTGGISAILGPLLPRFAVELSKSGHGQFRQVFFVYQRRLLWLISAMYVGLLLLPKNVWIFLLKDSAESFFIVFPVLLAATCFRLVTVLYGLAILGANAQHKVILSPLVEGVVNLTASIILACWIGPIGVAIGTLIGSVVCLLFHSLYNVPRNHKVIPLTPLNLIFPWKM